MLLDYNRWDKGWVCPNLIGSTASSSKAGHTCSIKGIPRSCDVDHKLWWRWGFCRWINRYQQLPSSDPLHLELPSQHSGSHEDGFHWALPVLPWRLMWRWEPFSALDDPLTLSPALHTSPQEISKPDGNSHPINFLQSYDNWSGDFRLRSQSLFGDFCSTANVVGLIDNVLMKALCGGD